tara:strand:- start:1438 stop:2517 length:1080 start_codon:yes stop_codon:yes gene_type:complete
MSDNVTYTFRNVETVPDNPNIGGRKIGRTRTTKNGIPIAYAQNGKQVRGTNADEILTNHGLDFGIEVEPIFRANGEKAFGKNTQTHQIVRQDTGQTFGTCTSKYEVLQNRAALEVMDELVNSGYGVYDRIGVRNGGQTLWTSIKLDTETYKVGGFDDVNQYVYMANHNHGNGAVNFTPANVRFGCTNQYAFAAKQISAAGINLRDLSCRHSAKLDERIKQAVKAIGIVNTLNQNFFEQAEALYEVELDLAQREKIYADTLSLSRDEKLVSGNNKLGLKTRGMNTMNAIFELEKSPLNASIADTAWGTLNTITEFFDHRHILNSSGDIVPSKVDSVMFGTAARQKSKAMETILQVAGIKV